MDATSVLYDSEESGEEQARQARRAARRQAARPLVHLPGSVPLTVQDVAAAMGVLDTEALLERVLEFGEDVRGGVREAAGLRVGVPGASH